MTQTERQVFYQQMRWLIRQSPEMTQLYKHGYIDAERIIWMSTPSQTVRRTQLKRAPSPSSLAYRLGWNDCIDNFAHNTFICTTCGEMYSNASGMHRCPPCFDPPPKEV